MVKNRTILFFALPIAGCIAAWIIYAPFIARLKSLSSECALLEKNALEARNVAASSWSAGGKPALIQESQISTALDEITRSGKEAGINFTSIAPHGVEKPEGSLLRILPVELETKSLYKPLGFFLGELQGMETVFITVKHIEIKTDLSTTTQVIAKIVLDLYLSN